VNLVDSSAWLEYFANGKNAGYFGGAIEDVPALLVSTINVYKVFKRVAQQRDENDALYAVAVMGQGTLVEVDESIALEAARLSLAHKLAMADSLILATARAFDAILWTQDADFEGLPGVKFRRKA
jgi:predicted nucleic acid-binding protein